MTKNIQQTKKEENCKEEKNFLTAAIVVVIVGLCISLSAQVEIEASPVPITGQTFAIIVCALLFGRYRATAGTLLYILAGILGAPVFAGGASGIEVLSGYSGGYLIGFALAAFAVGWLADKKWNSNFWLMFSAAINGHAIILLCGTIWLYSLGADMPLYESVSVFMPSLFVKSVAASFAALVILRTENNQKIIE